MMSVISGHGGGYQKDLLESLAIPQAIAFLRFHYHHAVNLNVSQPQLRFYNSLKSYMYDNPNSR